jgi:hypothetical protein
MCKDSMNLGCLGVVFLEVLICPPFVTTPVSFRSLVPWCASSQRPSLGALHDDPGALVPPVVWGLGALVSSQGKIEPVRQAR